MKPAGFATVTLALLLPCAATASPLFEIVGGSNGPGGLAARAASPSAASTYFNPALLADAAQEFDLGALVLSDQISLTLDGRPGGDVPLVVGDRTALDPGSRAPIPNDTVPTSWLQRGCAESQCSGRAFAARPRQGDGSSGNTRAYTTIGLVSRIRDPWLVLGLHAIVPVGDFTTMRSFYNDEREQLFSNSLHPELYADQLTATSLAFGAGSRVSKLLSFGLSFTLSLTNSADARTYVRDPVDYGLLQLDNEVKVTTAVSPHFGATLTPTERLRLSATFHTEQELIIRTGIAATLPSGSESRATLEEVHDFVPWTAAVGGSYDAYRGVRHTLGVVWTATYEAWSRYRDRHGETPRDEGADLGFRDIVTAAMGLRHTHGALRTYVDFQARPSPIPEQVGRSNYVDNDRLGIALGADVTVELFGFQLRPGLGAVAHRLLPRYQKKRSELIRDEVPDGAVDRNLEPIEGTAGLQTNNPGWPGFASEGWIYGGSVWLALLY
jgi:hypothetical protein